MSLDLTAFGFTPTESLVYQVLIAQGPGTGYAIAKGAGLARANTYAALEGLVTKGAARREAGRPRQYRPEPPSMLLARIVDRQGEALDRLAAALSAISVPASPTLTEVTSLRGVHQVLSLEIARAARAVALCLPGESYTALAPALRRAASQPAGLRLFSDTPAAGGVAPVQVVDPGDRWPGRPVLAAMDGRLGLIAALEGEALRGYWGTSPAFVAAAELAIAGVAGG